MHCTNCGNKLSDTAKFCPVCGSRVDAEPPVQQGFAAQPQEYVPQPQEQPAPQAPQEFVPQPQEQPVPQAAQEFVPQSAPQPAPQDFAPQPVPQAAQEFVPQPVPQAPQVPQGYYEAPQEKPKKPKKFLKWLIPVIVLAVAGITLLVIQLVYTSRPAFKVRKAVEKTIEPAGVYEAFADLGKELKDGSGTVEIEYVIGQGNDVDSFLGQELTGSNRPVLNVKTTHDASGARTRSDIKVSAPSLQMDTTVSLFLDKDKLILSCPDYLSENLMLTLTESKNGFLKDTFGKSYDGILAVISELARSGADAVALEKGVQKIIDEFWDTLGEIGFQPIEAEQLEEGETGYKVIVSGEQMAMFGDKAIAILRDTVREADIEKTVNRVLESMGERKDFEDQLDDISKDMHRDLDRQTRNAEFCFVIKNGTISDLTIGTEGKSSVDFEFIGKEGDYPLQNFAVFFGNYGYMISGKTRTDGIEKNTLYSAYKNGKRSIEENYEMASWSYNKETKEFTLTSGDVTGGYHSKNATSTSFDGYEIKATFGEESGAKVLKYNKIALFRNDSEVLNIEGSIKVSDNSTVADVTGTNREIGDASSSDFTDIFGKVSSSFSQLFAGGLRGFSLPGLGGGYYYDDYDYYYDGDGYDYDYGYDDYGYDYYDDYDYDDYDDYGYYDDYDYEDYDYGDYSFDDFNLDDYSQYFGSDGEIDYNEIYDSLGDLFS